MGCLFVADDGELVAGLTWVDREGMPRGYRSFDGLEFWGRTGRIAAYRRSRLPSGRVPVVDLPVCLAWMALHPLDHRGGNLARQGDELRLRTFGFRSFTFSLKTGEIVGWHLNFSYIGCLAFIYAAPIWCVMTWIVGRWRSAAIAKEESPAGKQQPRTWATLITNRLGAFLVILNSAAFTSGVFLDSFGGALDQLGAHICRATYPLAFLLIPVSLILSASGLASDSRRFDLLGPWLAIISAVSIVALLHA